MRSNLRPVPDFPASARKGLLAVVAVSCPTAPVYRPRQPRASPLYRLIERYLPEFERTYDQRYAPRYAPRYARYGSWRPIIGQVARKFLRCGDLHFGFARVRCPDCPDCQQPTANCQLTTTQILRHCGLWEGPLRTLPSARGPPGRPSQVPEPRCDLELVLDPELELVLDPEFAAAEAIPSETHRPRELQLVLDPEFL